MTHDDLYAHALTKSSKRIADNIDNAILYGIFTGAGWTSVTVPKGSQSEMRIWIETRCAGKAKLLYPYWVFEKESDATLFILKWS